MKTWLPGIIVTLAAVSLAVLRIWFPIPFWAIYVALFTALLFCSLYIHGHNLIQAESDHKQKMSAIAERGIRTRRTPIK